MVLDSVPSGILIVGSIICIFGGGLAAGLTIGIMSLDNVGLELLIESGDPKEAGYARKLAPIRKKGNLLLVTLLLTNTVFNELLPLFIDHIDGVNAAVALILPTVTVMIFGEIIPQSFCSRYGLSVGAHCVWLVRFLQLLFFPIAYPMAWLLDRVLGEELGNIYSHKQLKGLIDIHSHKRYLLMGGFYFILFILLSYLRFTITPFTTPIVNRIFNLLFFVTSILFHLIFVDVSDWE